MAEPDGLVLYCSPVQYRDLRIREELRPAFDIAVAELWDGDPDTLIPLSECLDCHRQAYGPTTEQSTNMQDEIAKLDAGLLRPKDLKEPAVSDPDSKVNFGDNRDIAALLAQLEKNQQQVKDNIMKALGYPMEEPVKVDPRFDRSTWSPSFREQIEEVERQVEESVTRNESLSLYRR